MVKLDNLMASFIKSITVEHYRGFKERQTLELADFNQITFLVGPNNSGKSLIGRLLVFPFSEQGSFSDNFFFDLITNRPIIIGYEFGKEILRNNPIFAEIEDKKKPSLELFLSKINDSYPLRKSLNVVGKSAYWNPETKTLSNQENIQEDFKTFCKYQAHGIFKVAEELLKILEKSTMAFHTLRTIKFIPENSSLLTGSGISNWHYLPAARSHSRNIEKEINSILTMLGFSPPDSIEIRTHAPGKEDIEFNYDGIRLNSDEIGMGLTTIYLLLLDIFHHLDKKIVFIDEIESHLQPGLIRKLIGILRNLEFGGKRLDIQWILSTHSPTVLDCAEEGDQIYRFQKIDTECIFQKFFRGQNDLGAMRRAANDLGVLPGDSLLANVVIWVEGPNDVLWVRALINAYIGRNRAKQGSSFNLIEGLHFSILTTGGGLIKHFHFSEGISIEDQETELKSAMHVLRINPNPFVIIDSDGAVKGSGKHKRALAIAEDIRNQNETQTEEVKKYLGNPSAEIEDRESANEVKNFWWLKGKEIENYCPKELLKKFYAEMNGKGQVKTNDNQDWKAYSETDGLGKLLADRNVVGVCTDSGTIKQKGALASFVYENLKLSHLTLEELGDGYADLMQGLERLVGYIKVVNRLG